MRVSTCLRKLRMRRGWYMTELSAASGVDSCDISRYETGKQTPSLATAIRLADALDVTLDVLVGRATLPPEPKVPTLRQLAERRSA